MIPDDKSIKAEIEDISRRIDHIVKTLSQLMPERDTSESVDASGDAGRGDGIP